VGLKKVELPLTLLCSDAEWLQTFRGGGSSWLGAEVAAIDLNAH